MNTDRTLTSYIDQQLDAGIIDPAEAAEKLMTAVPGDVLEHHMQAFLTTAVRDRIGDRNRMNPILRGAAAAQPMPTHPAQTPQAHSGISHKLTRRRAMFADERARWQADAIWTGTRRVTLGAATVPDLRGAAEAMRVQAKQVEASAVRLDQVAEAVVSAGVATVADLPDEVVRALMAR